MLEKVTKKAYHELSVSDQLGNLHNIKVLNFTASGSRTSKLDRQCVADYDTLIEEGMLLALPDGKKLVVSYKQADIYKDKIIRYVFDCITTTHTVNIVRTVLNKSKQGGLSSQADVIVYSDLPVKIGISDIVEQKTLDMSAPKYIMLLSKNYSISNGDRIVISDTAFEVAKVESYVHVTPGLMEVRFDKDPRWL